MHLKTLIKLTCFSLILFTSIAHALTVTKTYFGPTVEIDDSGEYGKALPSLDFNSTDFYNDAVVSQVTVSIDWTKTDGTCSNQLTGNAFHPTFPSNYTYEITSTPKAS